MNRHAPRLTITQVFEHVENRIPVLAAGMLHTPKQAQTALELGLSLVAVGKGLVMNPNWVELALSGSDEQLSQALDPNRREALSIPNGLWRAIEAAPGWIPVRKEERGEICVS